MQASLAALPIRESVSSETLISWERVSRLWKDQLPEGDHILVTLPPASEPKLAVAINGYY
jgi:hypothetical protein